MAHNEPDFLAKISRWFLTAPRVTDNDGPFRANLRRWTAWSSSLVERGSELVPTLPSLGVESQQQSVAVFSGPVADVPIAELVQTIGMGRKDGVIVVRHSGRESRVWCLGGEVVDAESGQLNGDLAFYRIMGILTGHVHADFRAVPRVRTIHASVQALVLEAARRKDECDMLRRRLGSADCVYSPATESLASARHDRSELGLLRAFYPGATLDEALADSHLGDLEALQIAVTLVEQGWLVPNPVLTTQRLSPPAPTALSARHSSSTLHSHLSHDDAAGPRRSPQRLVVLGAALVAAVAAIALRQSPAPTLDTAHGLVSSPVLAKTPPAEHSDRSPSSIPLGPIAATPADPRPTDLPPLVIEVETAPSEATLWLDGARAAQGRLSLRLPRDGRTHELEVTAPGYQTERVLFNDTPPPSLIALDPTVSEAPRAPERTAEAPLTVTPPRRPSRRLDRPRTSPEESPTAPGTHRSLGAVAHMPRVQIIANEDPTISVLE